MGVGDTDTSAIAYRPIAYRELPPVRLRLLAAIIRTTMDAVMTLRSTSGFT